MRRWVVEYGWFVMMGAVVIALGCIWYEVHQANAHSSENNRILRERTDTIQNIERCACGE